MGASDLVSRLRRLSHAIPGDGVLQLPAGLSSPEAIQTIRAALKALEPSPPLPRRQPTTAQEKVRIHIDGASRGNPGPAGVGVVIIGPDGDVVERLHRGIGEATNNVAEYRALLLGLERAQALDYADVDVYSDSELLVRQLQGRYLVKNPALKKLYEQAKERIGRCQSFSIQHVPREQNAEADALANRGIDEADRRSPREKKTSPYSPRPGEKE